MPNIENVYRKKDKRYIPIGVTTNYLPDGIWYIRHTDYGIGTTNVDQYLSGVFKVGNPTYQDFAEICGLQDTRDYILVHPKFKELIDKSHSLNDLVGTILVILKERQNEMEKH